MTFAMPQKVLFKHCDPAGIVFYPRYFEMMNDCVEAFFDQALGVPFEDLHTSGGVPTVQIQTRFVAPSRHGDHLVLKLGITKIGTSSTEYNLKAFCADELRFDTTATLVNINKNSKAAPWCALLRAKLLEFKETSA